MADLNNVTRLNKVNAYQEEMEMLEESIEELNEHISQSIEELNEHISLVELIATAPSGPAISVACDSIKRLLLEKNVSYGNSALAPISIFAKDGAAAGIAHRIDDKLNRIKNNQTYVGDNDLDDLIGYLILYKISISLDK